MSGSEKVFILGLDGMSFDLVRPWMASGVMPNLQRLLEEGTAGPLRSVMPPNTAPAWTSFYTGKNPGKHGVFDLTVPDFESMGEMPASRNLVHGDSLWEILSRRGRRVVVQNVPVTYPPKAVNGVLLCDFLAPKDAPVKSHPPDAMAKIEAELGPYRMYYDQCYTRRNVGAVIRELNEVLDYQVAVAKMLVRSESWDFYIAHYFGTDRAQHEIWHLFDETHPSHDKAEAAEWQDKAIGFFGNVDRKWGEVVRMAEEQGATIIAMSDHGFGPIRWYFAINNWLLDQGYLVLKGGAFNRFRRLAFRLGFTPNTAYKLLIALGLQNLRQSAGIGSRHTIFAQLSRVFLSLQDVDWSRTRAYSKGNYGQIYVNTKGREKHGVVAPGAEAAALRKEIAEKVAEVRDPETGGPMFQVFLQDDIYSGDQAWRGCDVFPLPVNMEYKALGTMDFITNKFLEPSYAQSGDHRVDGIFFMKGEGVRAGQWIEGARVFDVAPTVLHRMGLPIPKDMDGVPLTQCYEPGWLEGRAPAYSDDVSSGTSVDQELTEEELAQIQENLKGLGYLG